MRRWSATSRDPRFEVEVTILESMGSELYAYFETEAEVRAEQLDELAADTGGESSSDSGQIVARLDATSEAKRGERIELWMDSSKLHFFDLESGERISGGERDREPGRVRAAAPTQLSASRSRSITSSPQSWVRSSM